jgi:flagellar biosynthesis protein FliQ
MNEETVLDLAAKTIWLSVQIAAPPLLAALVTGLVISIFQAATQINEQTLSFIPKVLIMLLAMVICGPWIMQKMMGFTINLIQEIPTIGH